MRFVLNVVPVERRKRLKCQSCEADVSPWLGMKNDAHFITKYVI